MNKSFKRLRNLHILYNSIVNGISTRKLAKRYSLQQTQIIRIVANINYITFQEKSTSCSK